MGTKRDERSAKLVIPRFSVAPVCFTAQRPELIGNVDHFPLARTASLLAYRSGWKK